MGRNPWPKKNWEIGNLDSKNKVLIVYDPDPFYNLDEHIYRSLGQALADNGMQVRIATVRAAGELKDQAPTLYVFCANTYNWRPGWATTKFINKQTALEDKAVVAITLGSGSTDTSQKALEN